MAKSSTTTSTPASTSASTESSKYETMIVGVPKARKDTRAKLDTLSQQLGCKASALIWAGIDLILASPPKVAPAGAASSNTGSAAGFWVIHRFENNKIAGVDVKEVAKRADGAGRTFFRYTAGDDKGRTRARNQAIRAAQYDAKMVGLSGDIKPKDLPKAAAAKA